MTDERRARGLAIFREVYGEEMADGIARTAASETPFVAEQSRWTLDWPFGSVWARPGLERKMRSCAVLGMMIAGGHKDEIRFHTKMGLANGLTRAKIEEIFLTTIPYCGFPTSNIAKAAMLEAFAELDAQ